VRPPTSTTGRGHPKRLVEHSRLVGIIRDADFPPSIDEWAVGLRELRAAEHAG
jgi:hypothetical protein